MSRIETCCSDSRYSQFNRMRKLLLHPADAQKLESTSLLTICKRAFEVEHKPRKWRLSIPRSII